MKITGVKGIVLRLPDITMAADGTQDTCLVRIDTDAGISGWGEVDSAPTVVRAAIEAPMSNAITCGIASALKGQDPLGIDACMQRVYDLTQYDEATRSAFPCFCRVWHSRLTTQP